MGFSEEPNFFRASISVVGEGGGGRKGESQVGGSLSTKLSQVRIYGI